MSDVTDRLQALEERLASLAGDKHDDRIDINQIPLEPLKRKLEQTWLPDADTFLLRHTVGEDSLENIPVYQSLIDAKGDLIVGAADNTPAKLTVGANGTVAAADSTATNGVAWAELLWTLDIDPLGFGTGNTNWSTLSVNVAQLKNGTLNSSGAQNDEIYWDVVLSAGTWTFALVHLTANNRGFYTVSIDGTSAGTIDGYSAATTNNVPNLITGIVVATTGKKRLKLKMATKNAASASFFGSVTSVAMRRTA